MPRHLRVCGTCALAPLSASWQQQLLEALLEVCARVVNPAPGAFWPAQRSIFFEEGVLGVMAPVASLPSLARQCLLVSTADRPTQDHQTWFQNKWRSWLRWLRRKVHCRIVAAWPAAQPPRQRVWPLDAGWPTKGGEPRSALCSAPKATRPWRTTPKVAKPKRHHHNRRRTPGGWRNAAFTECHAPVRLHSKATTRSSRVRQKAARHHAPQTK
mmetsp:Transcript_101664/g.286646  ORF Transcript_101664/g.286646 Transcript_101664/m.286646 type:complete len:213 (+) Transcript_101664:226-864(+)